MINPFFYFKLWLDNQGTVIGQQLTIDEYQALLKQRYRLQSFTGRIATVCTVTIEPSISRPSALDFSVKFMEGKLINIDIDLDKLTATTTTTNPPPSY